MNEEVDSAYSRTSTAEAAIPSIAATTVGDAPPFYKNDKYYRIFVVTIAAFVMLITPVGSDLPDQLAFIVANAVFMLFWAGTCLGYKMSDRVRSTLPVNWPWLTWYGDCNFFIWNMLAACTTANLLRSDEGIGLKEFLGDGRFQRAEVGCAFTFFIWFAQTAQLYFTRKAYAEWVEGEGQFAGLNPSV